MGRLEGVFDKKSIRFFIRNVARLGEIYWRIGNSSVPFVQNWIVKLDTKWQEKCSFYRKDRIIFYLDDKKFFDAIHSTEILPLNILSWNSSHNEHWSWSVWLSFCSHVVLFQIAYVDFISALWNQIFTSFVHVSITFLTNHTHI